jgi:tetratricopeptide (TPR) repeat protein
MGAGLLAVKSGFILFIKNYQFSLQINTLKRERERERENEKGIDFFNQALKSGKELAHRAAQGSLYLDLGTHYLKVGKTVKGIELCEDALKILKEIVDPEVSKEIVDPKSLHLHLKCQCSAYLVLGAYYFDFGTQAVKAGSPPKLSLGKDWFEKVISLYEGTVKFFQELGDRITEWIVSTQLGICYHHNNQFEKAIKVFEPMRDGYRRLLGGDHQSVKTMSQHLGTCYNSMVWSSYRIGQFDKATEILEQARAIYEEMADGEGLATVSLTTVKYYESLGQQPKHCKSRTRKHANKQPTTVFIMYL